MHKKTSHDVRRNKELFIKNTTTTKRTCSAWDEVSYPQLFNLLAPDQRWDAWKQLQRFPVDVQQNILDEWQARCLVQDIHNPAAYLFGIIKKAKLGTFRANEIFKNREAL